MPRPTSRARFRTTFRRGALHRVLAIGGMIGAVIAATGCATSVSDRSAPVETRDEYGFELSETERIGMSARASFEKALRALEREEFDRGIALLLEVTAAEPHVSAAHINLGIAYRRIDELEKAEASLQHALDANPRHPVVHNELGIVYRKTGRFEQARESYEAALELHPEFHFARKNLGILCDLYLGDPACALENYERYLEAVPGDEMAEIWIADLRNRTTP